MEFSTTFLAQASLAQGGFAFELLVFVQARSWRASVDGGPCQDTLQHPRWLIVGTRE